MTEPLRLLMIGDSADDATRVESALDKGGFAVESRRLSSGDALCAALGTAPWDVAVLDHETEALDTLRVLQVLRDEAGDLPAILLAGRIGEQAVVEVMRAGARDVVGKGNLARLAPAVRRELEERAIRRERRAAEAKYAVAFRSSPNSIALTAVEDGRFLEVNPAFEAITGYRRDEVLGKTTRWLGIWPHDEARRRFLRTLELEGSVRDQWLPVRHKDGTVRQTLMSAEIVDLPEGRGILSVVRDVTEERRTLEALELSEERFSKAFFANPNPAVITTLADGEILEVNQVACDVSGLRRDEMIGRDGVELGLWDREHAERMARLLQERGAVRGVELRTRSRDGTTFDLLLSAVVVEMAGQPCILNVAVDLTERKKLQSHLLRVQRLESIGTLASGIAHDLNNVLTPILMAIRLLRKGQPEQRERVLGILEANARRGADLIRQLLTFARGSEGRRVPVGVDGLVQDVAAVIRDTFPKSIDLEVHLEPDLWTVEGDPTQIHQLLLNLAVNARDAMEGAGTLVVHGRNRTLAGSADGQREPGRYVELDVTDSGPGVPQEIRRQVFDPFFTTKAPGLGTGLGLFTAESIVAAHGGFIDIGDGDGGRGARFRVFLPVAGMRPREAGRHALLGAAHGDGELVLVVDDEEAVREIAAGVLEASGYRTVPAADGRAALARYRERRDEVWAVVVDLMMPGMDGAETIRALRREAPDLPIVAMSGVEGRASGGEPPEGADLLLSKPLTAEDLLGALRRVAGRSRRATAGATVAEPP